MPRVKKAPAAPKEKKPRGRPKKAPQAAAIVERRVYSDGPAGPYHWSNVAFSCGHSGRLSSNENNEKKARMLAAAYMNCGKCSP